MTENDYFVTHSASCCICDSISRKLEDGSFEHLSYEEIVNRLNEQHETIQKKQHTINEMAKAIRIYDDEYTGLNKENQRLLKANLTLTAENTNILQTIRQTYQSERTALGRSVLKQLIENLEGE